MLPINDVNSSLMGYSLDGVIVAVSGFVQSENHYLDTIPVNYIKKKAVISVVTKFPIHLFCRVFSGL